MVVRLLENELTAFAAHTLSQYLAVLHVSRIPIISPVVLKRKTRLEKEQ